MEDRTVVTTAPPPPSEVKIRTMRSDIATMRASGGGAPQFQSVAVQGLSLDKASVSQPEPVVAPQRPAPVAPAVSAPVMPAAPVTPQSSPTIAQPVGEQPQPISQPVGEEVDIDTDQKKHATGMFIVILVAIAAIIAVGYVAYVTFIK